MAAALLFCFAATGCGDEDVDKAREDARERYRDVRDDVRAEVRKRSERIRERIEEVLGDLERALPEARQTSPTVRSRGRNEPQTIDAFMEGVLRDIDAYWTKTLRENGRPAPRVSYVFVPPGRVAAGRCTLARDTAAFYCPADDTIYVGQRFAADLYNGVLRGLPGERAGYDDAAGDFAVAYVLAHEYAHNLQQEFGIFNVQQRGAGVKPFELQADCMAGTWANSVYEQGLLEPSDLEELVNTALAVGDFERGSTQHHGTPEERRDALLSGYRSGDPSVCSRYVPQV